MNNIFVRLHLFLPFYLRRFQRWLKRLRGINTYEMAMEELNDHFEMLKINLGLALMPTLKGFLEKLFSLS
jgi:hypothetical protein